MKSYLLAIGLGFTVETEKLKIIERQLIHFR